MAATKSALASERKTERRAAKPVAGKPSRYWQETRRPLVSLVFVAPLLLVYEGGLLVLGPQAMRNGADVWLRRFLEWLGFSQFFLLPALTCGFLLAWHHLNRDRWSIPRRVLGGMLLECCLFGATLLLVAHCQSSLLATAAPCAISWNLATAANAFSYLGAGIYEELLFRLMLLPSLAVVLCGLGLTRTASLVSAAVLSSFLFATAHYQLDLVVGPLHWVNPVGDAFAWPTFIFRLAAGSFFSILFLYRGFGIAVGVHALYDILVIF